MSTSSDLDHPLPTRVVLRPVATPLPLGFLALGVATLGFAAVQLGWVDASQGHAVALGVLVLTVPLQLLAATFGFLVRDPVAATGMGVLSGTWAGVCLVTLSSPPGALSPGSGVLLLGAGACLLVPAAAARAAIVPAAVVATSAVRFAVTGIAQVRQSHAWLEVAGWIGVVLAALSLYAALALELEASSGRTVLPLGRRGVRARALDGRPADQIADLPSEPGVRRLL
ncbi:hypothetical protein K8Z61_13585 [Nocardioides sp. TRM66260-LWL]|uniref:hypothetical protein n=1 Tax=Nocardioides sp. TRM66260-LWL TaxID=2874478 RepID=UPI001CC4A09E|nr:hypothetical protein [Nocardioides sp. TRM66260-LWL]MBZ5735526.1 hypothetical protein [Nocardioides sp. TRM66260-LWL]